MATYANLGVIASDGIFQGRVGYAMISSAISVYNEAAGTTGHAQRKAFASLVLNGQYNLLTATQAVLTNTTIAAMVTMTPTPGANALDTDIQFAVNSNWNALAGA